jgi:transposase
VESSQLPALHTFVTGVQQDKDAVLAGLTLPWSTGPVEGQINRLKLIKRSMYDTVGECVVWAGNALDSHSE